MEALEFYGARLTELRRQILEEQAVAKAADHVWPAAFVTFNNRTSQVSHPPPMGRARLLLRFIRSRCRAPSGSTALGARLQAHAALLATSPPTRDMAPQVVASRTLMSENLAAWRCQAAPRSDEIVWPNLGYRVWERTRARWHAVQWAAEVWGKEGPSAALCSAAALSLRTMPHNLSTVCARVPPRLLILACHSFSACPTRSAQPGHVGRLLGHGSLLYDSRDRGAGPADHELVPGVSGGMAAACGCA